MTGTLDEILTALNGLSEGAKAGVIKDALTVTAGQLWIPNPGPQTDAYYSEADDLFYGGQAGGGKSALICGLSLTAHKRSLVLRRTNKEANKFVDEYEEIIGHRDGYNSQKSTWRLDGKIIDLGGCQHEDDKQGYKGVPRDFYGFDEISDFTESQFRFIKGWNRSTDPDQRCRVVCAGNPPTTPEGLWVFTYWAPWLDETYPNPARPGELRWFTTINGVDTEVDGPGPHLIDGEWLKARSRTFIPAALSDNPDLARTDYGSVLAALPSELREAYKDGKFKSSFRDDEFQVIPTDWILAAQARWTEQPPEKSTMSAIGVDVAQGGSDQTTLAPRYGDWYGQVQLKPGIETPKAADVISFIMLHRRDNAIPIVDVGGGYGGEVVVQANDNGMNAVAFNGAKQGVGRTACRQFGFANKRAEAHWRFREALDPSQDFGSPIALPPDPILRADLAAPRWKRRGTNIIIEEKEEIKKRIGRSPDRGDAVIMAYSEGNKALAKGLNQLRGGSRQKPKVNLGYTHMKKRRK